MAQKNGKSSLSDYKLCVLAMVFVTHYGAAAETRVTPTLGAQFTYTDNINSTANDKKSSVITTFDAGVGVTSTGNDNDILSFNYQAQKLLYSDDSSKNGQYNELSLNADSKLLENNKLRGSLNASVSNISSSIGNNADNDLASGGTIESRNADLGLYYQSNPAGVADLYARIDGAVADYEDNVGNNDSLSGKITFAQGQAVKTYFWATDYSYKITNNRNDSSSTTTTQWDQKLGLQPTHNLSPYLHWYYEDYSGNTQNDSADSSSWGPGIRYYFSKNSYAAVSYEFALDNTNSNHWNGSLFLNPTSRTQLRFDYTQRFYGDAYDVSITHSNRRMINSISYTEEITNFNRDLYVDGTQIENLTISKRLSWSSTLNLRRTTIDFSLSADEQNAMNQLIDLNEAKTYSAELSLVRKLSEKTTLTPSFMIKSYRYNSQAQIPQKDYYRKLGLELNHSFAHNLQFGLVLSHRSRSSTTDSNQYAENRINFNVRKSL